MASYSKEYLDKLKANANVLEIVSKYVPDLKEQGSIYRGRCPFPEHEDLDGSFTVYPATNTFYCFGCGAGSREANSSDIISFIQRMENCSFPEAVRKLQVLTGINPEVTDTPEQVIAKKSVASLVNASHEYLSKDPKAQEFLTARGITQDEMDKYMFGVTTYKEEVRVSIPIYDEYGYPVGLSYRTMESKEPKYINSKSSVIFSKDHLLWGLNFIKQEIKKWGFIIVTEGYFDAISLQRQGLPAVALMDNSISDGQIELLKKYSDNVIIFMDNDAGGFQHQKMISNKLFKSGINAKIVIHEFKDKDPDEIARLLGEGIVDFVKNNSHILSEYIILKRLNAFIEKSNALKRDTLKSLKDTYADMVSDTDKEIWIKHISVTLNMDKESVRASLEE